ncbi:MAG: hypothetical protein BAA04_02050 [Firmicutes bacterium ZCTH02-B6]|nr:MAG: hypothetical protein BAA04_02050 [Firmicutes bacterium ZCTH02-B6]
MDNQWGRLGAIVVFGVGSAVVLFGVGLRGAAAGVLAGTPISMVNHFMMHSAMRALGDRPDDQAQYRLMQRVMLRLLLSAVILAVAAPLGLEVLLGVLTGVLAEVMVYFGDAAKAALGRKG